MYGGRLNLDDSMSSKFKYQGFNLIEMTSTSSGCHFSGRHTWRPYIISNCHTPDLSVDPYNLYYAPKALMAMSESQIQSGQKPMNRITDSVSDEVPVDT